MAATQSGIAAHWQFEVPFYDVDSLGIVWHGHYCKYFERARCALLDQLDFDYTTMAAAGYSFPVIDIGVRYMRPLRFQQEVVVHALLQEWEVRLRIAYRIEDVHTKECLTRGFTVQAAVALHNGQMQLQTPAALRNRIATRL